MQLQLIFNQKERPQSENETNHPVFDLNPIARQLTAVCRNQKDMIFVFISEAGLRPAFADVIPGSAPLGTKLVNLGIDRIAIHKPALFVSDQVFSIYLTLNMLFAASLMSAPEDLEENLRRRGFEINEHRSGKKTLYLYYSPIR